MNNPFTSRHQEALELDLKVLESLLRRNHSAHRRTKYYQRTSMAVRCVQKSLAPLFGDVCKLQQELQEQVARERTKRKRQKVFWELVSASDRAAQDQLEQTFETRVQQVTVVGTLLLPQALSRIQHAAAALFTEIARGFFLPLCTIAVAALARIRTLLIQLGLTVASALPKLVDTWRKAFGNTGGSFQDVQEILSFLYSQQEAKLLSDVMQQHKVVDTDRLLEEMGLPQSSTRTAAGQMETEEQADRDPSPSSKVDEKDKAIVTEIVATKSLLEDDDVGETVSMGMMEAGTEVPAVLVAHPKHTPSHEADKNLAMVEDIKRSSKKKTKRSKDEGKPAKKKQKKSKKGGDDFFDELFG